MFPNAHDTLAFGVLIIAISLGGWVQYARTVRGSTLVERNKEYVQAARVIGVSPYRIMVRHVLPNVMGPVLVLATIQVAAAILTEATLSFLGVGVPPTSPSLGTLIRVGNDFLFSGEWWITIFRIHAGADRALREPAGRLAARRAQPEAALKHGTPRIAAFVPPRLPGADDMTAPLLEVRNSASSSPRAAHVAGAGRHLVRHRPGEILGVVGESGAGKSLTGRRSSACSNRRDASRGEIRLAGRRIDNLPTNRCAPFGGRQIGAIFQVR